jgi:hypothetical protein
LRIKGWQSYNVLGASRGKLLEQPVAPRFFSKTFVDML